MEQYRQSMYTILVDQDEKDVPNGKYALIHSFYLYQAFESKIYNNRHKKAVPMEDLKNKQKQKVNNFSIGNEYFSLDWVSQTELFDQLMKGAETYRMHPSLLKTSDHPYTQCAWIRRKGPSAWEHGIEVNPIVKVGDTELDQMRRGEQYDDIVEFDNGAYA